MPWRVACPRFLCIRLLKQGSRLHRRLLMAHRVIELDGLPAPVARGLEVVAELARVLAGLPSKQVKSEQSTKLSTRKGVVDGSLRRIRAVSALPIQLKRPGKKSRKFATSEVFAFCPYLLMSLIVGSNSSGRILSHGVESLTFSLSRRGSAMRCGGAQCGDQGHPARAHAPASLLGQLRGPPQP